jgi:hypothetical protein
VMSFFECVEQVLEENLKEHQRVLSSP